ncbi:hypothetical protein GALL_144200 [mine drainage metagenome]|uniref:Uncharacterized protein n=1 Tax=mine drainage metagenome TaxID=410659 RepID=A0A1J5S547_9ZZZZ
MSTEDTRLSYAEAVAHVQQGKGAAFAVTPVFGDDNEAAEGARVFVLQSDGEGGIQLRFVAGPFFSAAYAANETIAADEIPASVEELRFMPTSCQEEWFSSQVQVLINQLMNAAGTAPAQMPDYLSIPNKGAAPEVVFPMTFIERKK